MSVGDDGESFPEPLEHDAAELTVKAILTVGVIAAAGAIHVALEHPRITFFQTIMAYRATDAVMHFAIDHLSSLDPSSLIIKW